ncbi:MAG: amidohydrolase family protein, partial [Candidatus Thermoplasmatota archaeon]|nr:amidohydrolase family protein [Candidatus Thermoplasmatota archaeon]
PYILGHDLELPLRECVENQWQFSLATDFNPNCRSLSIPFVGSLATHRLGLNPLEALVAVTRNPATTLISSSEGELAGSLREGGPADLLILDSNYIDSWCQMPGDNPISSTIKSGSIV